MPEDSFWWRLTHLEPAIFKGVILAVVGILAAFGVHVSEAIPDSLIGFLIAALALVQAAWVRKSVTPNAKVVAYTEDPQTPGSRIRPGEAVTAADDATILVAARTPGRHRAEG